MMLLSIRLPLVALSIWLLLSGCSTNTDYLDAKTLPPIEAPDNLDKNRLGELYPVPEQSEKKAPKKFLSPFPPTVGIQDDANIASLQEMDEFFWVLNAKTPATTWAQLVNFWQQRQIPVASRDLSSATMVTDWFEEAVQPGYFVRYRLRLEQGLQTGTTDIYLDNEKRQVDDISNLNQIPSELKDPVHGNWMAQQLVTALNQVNEGVGDSYLAATIELPQKIRLAEYNDEPVLFSIASKERIDRALSKALNENGYKLYEKDGDQNVYYFGESKTIKNRLSGWFDIFMDHLFGETTTINDQPLDNILSSLPNEPEVNILFPDPDGRDVSTKLSGNRGYLLVLRQQAKQTVIFLRDSAGRMLPSDEAVILLDTIRLRLL